MKTSVWSIKEGVNKTASTPKAPSNVIVAIYLLWRMMGEAALVSVKCEFFIDIKIHSQ